MIYTYGNNGHYQTGLISAAFDNYAFIVQPPDTTPPRARHPIGVNQPPNGGTNYPFIRPAPNIERLLGDFYLSYPDDTCSYAYPFRIQWMYGFGDRTVTPPAGYPIPSHDYDILIKDANDITVFDSSLCGTGNDSDNLVPYATSVWYDRLVIIEWTNASQDTVCRCTKFIGWDSYSTDYQDYDEYIVPDAIDPDDTPGGILDPRTYNKLPLRVRSLKVRKVYGDLGTVLQGSILLRSNYNVELQVNSTDIALGDMNLEDFGLVSTEPVGKGSRLKNRISITSEPGLGTGTYPSCDPDDTSSPLRRLNSAKGDDKQNIILDAGDGCIRLQRPLELVGDCPRSFEFDGTAAGYSDTVAPHIHRFINDCSSCCDCDYFARTYQGLKRRWFAYQQIATDAVAARDQFKDNVTRWHYQKLCREGNPIVIVLRILPDCKADIGITFGNTSACCLLSVHVRLTFEYYNGVKWVEYPLSEDDKCDVASIQFAEVKTPETKEGPIPYELIGEFPVVDLVTDYMPASSTFQIGLKACFPGCVLGSKVRVSANIWWESVLTPDYTTCVYPDAPTIPSRITDIWEDMDMPIPPWPITFGVTSDVKNLNITSAFCKADVCKLPAGCDEPVG